MTLVQSALEKYRRGGLRSFSASLYRYLKQTVFGDRWFRYATFLRYKKQQYSYNAASNPWKVIFVDVDSIKYFNKEINTSWGLGRIQEGEWDSKQHCEPIYSTTHFRGFVQRFEQNFDWRDTVYYKNRKEQLSRNTRRLEYIDSLYEDMKTNRYRPNYEEEHNAPEGDKRQGRLRHIHALEPLVVIGRNGEIHLSEGFHRTAIAKILDIDEIPVNILARHEKWQQVREKTHKISNYEEISKIEKHIKHPDLADIIHK